MSRLYPAMLRLQGRPAVVIGGGQVAARKVMRLIEAGASVTVIAPTFESEVKAWLEKGLIRAHQRPYRRGDLNGMVLAFAATDSQTVNAAVADEAQSIGIP